MLEEHAAVFNGTVKRQDESDDKQLCTDGGTDPAGTTDDELADLLAGVADAAEPALSDYDLAVIGEAVSRLGEAKPHAYETKTVRVHEPDEGRYVYLMLTRFDGEGALLGNAGWKSEYIWYSVVSRHKANNVSGADPFSLARRFPGDWFGDSNAVQLMKDLDMSRIQWEQLSDEDQLTGEEIDDLVDQNEDEDAQPVATDGGVTIESQFLVEATQLEDVSVSTEEDRFIATVRGPADGVIDASPVVDLATECGHSIGSVITDVETPEVTVEVER